MKILGVTLHKILSVGMLSIYFKSYTATIFGTYHNKIMAKKSKKFEPTNETRNSDKTLRMMSPILRYYGIAQSIHEENTYVYPLPVHY